MRDNYVSGIGEIFNSLAGMGNIRDSNRNWLVEVVYNFKNELDWVCAIECPEWDRKIIMAADSYIEYCDRPTRGIKEKGFIKYDFLQKIIDSNNNLIILATPSTYEISVEYGDLNEGIEEEDESEEP